MLGGDEYDAFNPEFLRLLRVTQARIWEFNNTHPDEPERRMAILRDIFGSVGRNLIVNQPFRCDYGCNIFVGDNCIFNFNLTILDEARVTFGNNVFVGPNVSIYTACHPLTAKERNEGVEWAEPVTIGNDVWIGGSTVIVPGVTIGDGCVIGAGSVVTKSIPANTLAVGNPCRPIRSIDNPK